MHQPIVRSTFQRQCRATKPLTLLGRETMRRVSQRVFAGPVHEFASVAAVGPDLGDLRLGEAQAPEHVAGGDALHSRPDAVAALEVAASRELDLLPFRGTTEIPVQSGTISDRWTHRLTMCDPTAAHAILAQGKKAETFFIDPLTDMPVLRTPDNDGKQVQRYYAPLSCRT
jgi:hypothetical protein